MKRRLAVKPVIGHLKQEHKMGRNLLKGATGDRINALLSANEMNFLKLLKQFLHFFCRFLVGLFSSQKLPVGSFSPIAA